MISNKERLRQARPKRLLIAIAPRGFRSSVKKHHTPALKGMWVRMDVGNRFLFCKAVTADVESNIVHHTASF